MQVAPFTWRVRDRAVGLGILRKISIKGVNFLRAGCARYQRRIIWSQTCPVGHIAERTADCFEACNLLKFSIADSHAAENPLASQQSIEVDVFRIS